MRHLAYAAALVACLAVTVPLVPAFRLHRVRRIRRVAAAIGCAAAPFVVWDVLATRAGQWHFDAAQVLGVRLLDLPLEEWAFFVVIPFAAIACFEAVGALLGRHR